MKYYQSAFLILGGVFVLMLFGLFGMMRLRSGLVGEVERAMVAQSSSKGLVSAGELDYVKYWLKYAPAVAASKDSGPNFVEAWLPHLKSPGLTEFSGVLAEFTDRLEGVSAQVLNAGNLMRYSVLGVGMKGSQYTLRVRGEYHAFLKWLDLFELKYPTARFDRVRLSAEGQGVLFEGVALIPDFDVGAPLSRRPPAFLGGER
jgi:hypothetical protein